MNIITYLSGWYTKMQKEGQNFGTAIKNCTWYIFKSLIL